MNWKEFLQLEIFKFGKFELLVGNLLIACAILLGTLLLLMFLKRVILRPRLFKERIDDKRRMSIYLIAKYFIWIISVIFILQALGFQITALLIGSSALLIGLGLGLQTIFKDLVSGLFLLFEGTMKVGDIIEADGVIGRVVEINLRSSELITREDVKIIIPNSRFISDKVVNWSHDVDHIRFEITVGLAYGSDVEKAIVLLQEVLEDSKHVMKKPQSFVRFTDFGESSLDFELIFWSSEMFNINNIKSDLRRAVYKKLNDNNMVIPFPQRDVHIKGIENLSMTAKKD